MPLFIVVVLGANIPSYANADTTTAEFLQWERASQTAFIQNSMNMAGVITSQYKPEMARCLDDWYFGNREARNQEILDVMPELADFTPTAVLVAVINDVCGEF